MKFIQDPTPIPFGESSCRQFAFDGRYYYFTLYSQDKILQTTTDYKVISYHNTRRVYQCLCFDFKSCCFWASIAGCATRIFQLNMAMEEISSICLPDSFRGNITGISYHSCHDSLFLAFPWGVIEYLKKEKKTTEFTKSNDFITSVLVICPAVLILTRQGKKQKIQIYFDNDEKIKEITVPLESTLRHFIYQPCFSNTPRIEFLLTEQGCYPQILQVPVTCYELGFEPCFCNQQICEKLCCPPCACHPVEDVLESIALVEAAISHILNAQGEELQQVIADCKSTEEMLQVNCKINETITKVTHLEMVLQHKLEALSKLSPCDSSCSCDDE